MIVDASVGSKWILEDEVDSQNSRAILQLHRDRRELVTVPDLFFYEIANALATKSGVPIKSVVRSIRGIFKLNLDIYHPRYDDIRKAAFLAKQHKTTVYDMLYAVVAKKLKTTLVTADARFVSTTKFSHVMLLSDYGKRL